MWRPLSNPKLKTLPLVYIIVMNYYDGILLLIPSLLIGGIGVSFITDISIQATILVGAFIGVAVVGHGMFINPPVDSPVQAVVPDSVTSDAQDSQSFESASVVSDD